MSSEASEARQPVRTEAAKNDEHRDVEVMRARYEVGSASSEAVAQESSATELLAWLGETVGVEDLLHHVLQLLVRTANAGAGVIRLRAAEAFVARATFGMGSDLAPVPSPFVDTLLGSKATDMAPLLLDAKAAATLAEGLCKANEPGAALCVPLVHGPRGQLIGIACLRVSGPSLADAVRAQLAAVGARGALLVAERLKAEELTHSVHSRDEILGVVAHDLRNPLNVIAAAASSLHHRLSDSLSRRPVERIMRAAQRAEHLIRDLLDLRAIEGGHFAIDKRPIDTATTILNALDSQQGLAASASVILGSDLSPDLPVVEADEERIVEVLENLIGNAIKFTMAGGTVSVGAQGRGRDLVVWVKDNGPGIAPDQLTHLFDRFWQASKTDRRGTGLGLTICKGIVEAHGGKIWAESALGAGTSMFFSIPAMVRANEPTSTQVANILMVDDRPENLLSLRAILERPEYRLVTATSGEEALSLALRESFAVALLDIAMPGMDGLEVAIHMKELERSRDIPIIFITAFGDDPEEIHRAYSAGGADYLVKPLDAEIVRKKVAVFVDLSRRRHQGGPATVSRED